MKRKLLSALSLIVMVSSLMLISLSVTTTIEEEAAPTASSPYQTLNVAAGTVQKLDTNAMFSYVENGNVTGSGSIRWNNWHDLRSNILSSGNLKVQYINDPVYTSMKLPSEALYYMAYRVNPCVLASRPVGYINATGIGAVYPVTGAELPDEFDVCIGKSTTYILEKNSSDWKVFENYEPYDKITNFQVRTLPWDSTEYHRPTGQVTYYDDYVKIHLTKDDLNNGVLHFYGNKYSSDSNNILAYVVIYEVWSDTPGIENKLVATSGIDLRNIDKDCLQIFSSRAYLVSNEHRLVIGHNITDAQYDEFVASNKSPENCLLQYLSTSNHTQALGLNTYLADNINKSTTKNGIVLEGDSLRYYEDNTLKYAGLIIIDGYYYYANSKGTIVTGDYYVYKTNGLLAAGKYTFDATGKMTTVTPSQSLFNTTGTNTAGSAAYADTTIQSNGYSLGSSSDSTENLLDTYKVNSLTNKKKYHLQNNK